jgi:ubiquinone/menaquinone biosynthesis C-methylase UbiE
MRDLWSGTYRRSAVWEETAQALIELAELEPGATILDVGTGYGGTLFPALERVGENGRIVSIDVEEDCVDWTKNEIAKRGIRNAEVVRMNARLMSFPDNAFDGVIMGMVGLDEDFDFNTGLVINDAPLMREVLRVLKPGCYLYNSNWLWQDDNEWMGEIVRRYLPACTKRGYFPGAKAGYVTLLEFAGFDDIRATPFEGHYTFDDPAEWMAVVEHVWEEELEQIKAQPDALRAFEKDAFDLLAIHVNDEGKIAYTRSAILVSAWKPPAP